MLDKFEKFNLRVSGWCEWLALAALLLMMVITCIDVVGAKVFRWRLLGAIDIVMLSQIVAISFAAGMTLILGRHIQVEFFFNLLPRRAQAVINSVVLLLGFGLFILVICWVIPIKPPANIAQLLTYPCTLLLIVLPLPVFLSVWYCYWDFLIP